MGDSLADRAQGRWRDLLPALGVHERFLKRRHGPCPACGGTDRFRFDDKDGRGSFICSPDGNGCGAGDGVALVMRVHGIDFKEAARRIEELVGTARVRPAPRVRPERESRDAMNALWRAAKPVNPDDPVAKYVRTRVGLTTFPACIRTAACAKYDLPPFMHFPAMVAMLTNPAGQPAILHRTYLSQDGQKAPVDQPRLMMRGTIPRGSAVRLFEAGETLGIAEGLETAWAAANLFGIPVWAATNSALLSQWEPPPEVRRIVVFGDNDPKFGGAVAAYGLAHRLSVAGLSASVEIPDTVGQDWADVLAREAQPEKASA